MEVNGLDGNLDFDHLVSDSREFLEEFNRPKDGNRTNSNDGLVTRSESEHPEPVASTSGQLIIQWVPAPPKPAAEPEILTVDDSGGEEEVNNSSTDTASSPITSPRAVPGEHQYSIPALIGCLRNNSGNLQTATASKTLAVVAPQSIESVAPAKAPVITENLARNVVGALNPGKSVDSSKTGAKRMKRNIIFIEPLRMETNAAESSGPRKATATPVTSTARERSVVMVRRRQEALKKAHDAGIISPKDRSYISTADIELRLKEYFETKSPTKVISMSPQKPTATQSSEESVVTRSTASPVITTPKPQCTMSSWARKKRRKEIVRKALKVGIISPGEDSSVRTTVYLEQRLKEYFDKKSSIKLISSSPKKPSAAQSSEKRVVTRSAEKNVSYSELADTPFEGSSCSDDTSGSEPAPSAKSDKSSQKPAGSKSEVIGKSLNPLGVKISKYYTDDGYQLYIPKSAYSMAKSCGLMPCRGCHRCFKAGTGSTYEPSYYVHCMLECPIFQSLKLTRKCDKCRFVFISSPAYRYGVVRCPKTVTISFQRTFH